MIPSWRSGSSERNGDDQEAQSGSGSSPTSYYPNQSLQNQSFERMDRPIISTLYLGSTIDDEGHAAVVHQHDSFVAPSINNEPCVLDEILAPPMHNEFDTGCHPVTSRAHRSQLYEVKDHRKSTKPEEDHVQPDVPVPSSGLQNKSDRVDHLPTAADSEDEKVCYEALPGEITPYVGLRARLTQIPINRWTVLLLLVLARLIILFESLDTNLTEAQQEASSACVKVEDMASAMASMPYYLSVGVNELIAMRISDTVRALIRVMNMVLSAVVGLIMFVIERTYGTIVCVADTFVQTFISAVKMLVSDTIGALNEAIDAGKQVILDILEKLDTLALGGLDSAIDKVKAMGGIQVDAVLKGIDDLNKSVPDYKQITADVQAVVGLPFSTVQILLNESFGNWTMDALDLPTAPKETLTFCTGNDTITTFFEVLFIVAKSAKILVIAGLLVTILLATAFMLWWEVQRYRRAVIKSRVFHDREPMDTVHVAGRPLTAGAGLWIAAKLSRDPDRQMLIRWVVAYATTYTALFVLALAVGGAFSVVCQYFIMRAVQKETPALTQEVGAFVTNSMGALGNSSTRWAEESNQAILKIQNDINDLVFVHVQDASSSVVSAIDRFESEMKNGLDKVLSGSSFGQGVEKAVDGLLDCVIMNTLDKVKNALIWINSEAHVTFPEFPADIFSQGATNSGNASLAGLLTNAGTQTANEITVALNKIVISLQSGIIQEGLIALVLLLVYVAYVLFAVAQAALRMTCLRQRKPLDDIEKRAHAVEKTGRTSTPFEGEFRKSPSHHSLAPSYRLSNLDISQLARDLSVAVPNSPPRPVERSSMAATGAQGEAQHGDLQQGADGDPFGDDTYAIGDEEIDDIVDALRNSGEMAEDSTWPSDVSLGDDTFAIGDAEVDDIVGALRDPADVANNAKARDRWAGLDRGCE